MGNIDRSAGVVVNVAGRVFVVRRTHAVIKRIEDRFGAVAHLLDRVEQFDLTAVEIVDFYRLLMQEEADPPSADEVAAHIVDAGVTTACAPLREFCQRAWLGDEGWLRLVEFLSSKQPDPVEELDAGNAPRPGDGSSSLPLPSDGHHPSSGAPPTTNLQSPFASGTSRTKPSKRLGRGLAAITGDEW